MTYAISPAGLALIQDAEGFRAEPTRLPDGAWVVGYGHVRAEAGGAVTQAEAMDLLVIDVAPVERMVNANVTARLVQSQFDALVSFAFSVGAEAFVQSQVLRRVNNAEHVAAACALDAWRKAEVDGALEVVDALVRRRAAEKALYLKGTPVTPAPSAFLRAKLDYAASVLGAPVAYAPAPAVETARAVQSKPDACVRLAEILKSEPATEALLLTQVVPVDVEDDEEIATAHAKPVARELTNDDATQPSPELRLTRLSFVKAARPRLLDFSKPFETVGLIALMLFGAGVTLVGASVAFGGAEDMLMVVAAAALIVPGLAAVATGGWALTRAAALSNA